MHELTNPQSFVFLPTKHVYFSKYNRFDGMDIINLDDSDVVKLFKPKKGKEAVEKVFEDTNIAPFTLSSVCSLLISKINSSVKSPLKIRQVLKTNTVADEFDLVEHQDLIFVNVIGLHL